MIVWIVGRVKDEESLVWDFQGVFTTEDAAVNACRDISYFVGPATLDEVLPHSTMDWPDSYRPQATATL